MAEKKAKTKAKEAKPKKPNPAKGLTKEKAKELRAERERKSSENRKKIVAAAKKNGTYFNPNTELYGAKPFCLETFKKICHVIKNTSMRLEDILALNDDWPKKTVFYEWTTFNKQAAEIYNECRLTQQDVIIHDLVDKTSKLEEDFYYIDSEGNRRVDSGRVSALKIEVDTKKWAAARLSRLKWGDRVTVETDAGKKETYDRVLGKLKDAKKYERDT